MNRANHCVLPCLAISIVSVVLCVQLILLPSRGWIVNFFGKDRPYLQLCVASDQPKYGRCRVFTELSLNHQGIWVSRNHSPMDDSELQQFFHQLAETNKARNQATVIRVRIAAKTPAKRFIHLTHCAERAGIENISLVVWGR